MYFEYNLLLKVSSWREPGGLGVDLYRCATVAQYRSYEHQKALFTFKSPFTAQTMKTSALRIFSSPSTTVRDWRSGPDALGEGVRACSWGLSSMRWS